MRAIYKTPDGERAVRDAYLDLLQRWPIASDHLRVPTRYGETFVLACGRADAPPLVLLHGSAANAASWMADIVPWAEHFRVYAVDMIGEPGLSAASRLPLASDVHALWLDDVLEGLVLERVAIVGVSLGGWLALDYAARRPRAVEKLVLVCPSGVGRQKTSFLLKALPLLMLGKWGRGRVIRMVAGPAPANLSMPERAFGQFASLTFTHFKPRMEPIPIFPDEVLKRLTLPVLVVVGGKDVMLDSRETERFNRNTPSAQVKFLPDAPHVIRSQSQPILDFLLSARR